VPWGAGTSRSLQAAARTAKKASQIQGVWLTLFKGLWYAD
jgi:hypothetical protein